MGNNLIVSISLLIVLFILCGFFAATETSVMSLNRYRLKHLAKSNATARRLQKLLARPERLIGAILIGNTFALTYIGSLSAEMGRHFFGDWAELAPATIGTLLLICSEIVPKTVAALHPERVAFPLSWFLQALLWVMYPLVVTTSAVAQAILKLFGVGHLRQRQEQLSADELRTLVLDAKGMMSVHHQTMLLGILDLEKVSVGQIMVPKGEVIGVNLESNSAEIIKQLKSTQHTLLPVYADSLDNVKGILHKRDVLRLSNLATIQDRDLLKLSEEPYFVPEGTTLYQQLSNFQKAKRRLGLVVDEYGDIVGLVTLEDILEEIVGEFTTEEANDCQILAEDDGSYRVPGSLSLRELKRLKAWELPYIGPTTLSGLIIEYLETIPSPGTCVKIADYAIEVLEVKDNTIQWVRIHPQTQLSPHINS